MGSVNSINPLETTVLGYSLPRAGQSSPHSYAKLCLGKEIGQNKYNVTQKGKDRSVNSVQGEQKCKVKRKKGDHSCTYKYKNNQSG